MEGLALTDNGEKKKKHIVIVTMSGGMLLVFTGPADVFFNANKILADSGSDEGYEVTIATATAEKKVDTGTGMTIQCQQSVMEIITPIDTLIIAGNDFREASQENLADYYRWLAARDGQNTRRIASVCGGAFSLAKAGLLNGRKATLHWEHADKLQRRFPEVDVNSDPMYTKDGHVYTAAGGSSGIDLALAMVEEDYGKDIAIRVARRIVFYLSRPGYQTQFGNLLPVYESQHIARRAQPWLGEHLHEKLAVNQVAAYLNMSTRNFTRVFRSQTGMPPAKFIEKMRLEKARKYLEDTDMPVQRIAEECGLGGLVSMRRTFLRHLKTTPSDYRRSFKTALNGAETDNAAPALSSPPAKA